MRSGRMRQWCGSDLFCLAELSLFWRVFAQGEREGEDFGPDDELAELGGGEARASGVAGGVGGGLDAHSATLAGNGAHGNDGVLNAAVSLLRNGRGGLDSSGGDGRGTALGLGFALDGFGGLKTFLWYASGTLRRLRRAVLLHEGTRGLLDEGFGWLRSLALRRLIAGGLRSDDGRWGGGAGGVGFALAGGQIA